MNADQMIVFERIASALERQVAQHDEAVARNIALRDESISRNGKQRDEELKEAREANDRLFVILNDITAKNAKLLAFYESQTAVGAVDPHVEDSGPSSTRA